MPKPKNLVTKTNLDQVFREIKDYILADNVTAELSRLLDPSYIRVRILDITSRCPGELGESQLREIVQLAAVNILQAKEANGTLKVSKRVPTRREVQAD